MRMLRIVLSVMFATLGLSLAAADDAPELFNPKVNAWAEGTITAIDTEAMKFTIRGVQRPYATEYAKMLKEIEDKTAKLAEPDRAKKESEIRANWSKTLVKAQSENPGKESDFTFKAAIKDGTFSYMDESEYYGREFKAGMTPSGKHILHSVRDLKSGEFVVVGYASGVITNDAYIVLKATKLSSLEQRERTEAANAHAQVVLDPETEQALLIRRALVSDAELSVAAHNVRIDVKNGTAKLSGTVPTADEKKIVEQKAESVMGEGKIDSHLDIAHR